ncbi:MAG: AraC family ligand binding domain-containing protein [Chitinophagaceae bacterium]
MEKIKYNDSTRNRPDGERVVDADYVYSDMPVYIKQLQEEKSWDEGDRNAITIFKADQVTLVLTILKEGAAIIDNTIDGFITIQVMEGQVVVTTGEDEFDAPKGQLITFHPGIPHTVTAVKETVLLLTTLNKS